MCTIVRRGLVLAFFFFFCGFGPIGVVLIGDQIEILLLQQAVGETEPALLQLVIAPNGINTRNARRFFQHYRRVPCEFASEGRVCVG